METHDTSHITPLLFSRNFNTEDHVAPQIDGPRSQPPYAYVKAVLLQWAESDRTEEYIRETWKLEAFFKSLNFETELYPISINDSSDDLNEYMEHEQQSLSRKMRALGAPCLLIIYYAGHADKDDDRHDTKPGGPQHRRMVWRSHRIGGSYLEWYKVQKVFDSATFDLLLILDCSYSALASIPPKTLFPHSYGRIELLGATNDTAEAPQPEDGSFTNVMIPTMREMIKIYGSIDIAKLHILLVERTSASHPVPFYGSIRLGASHADMPERPRVVRDLRGRTTKLKVPTNSSPTTSKTPPELSSLSYSREEPVRNITLSQILKKETIESPWDIGTRKQPLRMGNTNPTKNIHTTTTIPSHILPILRGESTPSISEYVPSLEGSQTLYFTFMMGMTLVKLFARRLIKDTKAMADLEPINETPLHEFSNWLEVFAWRLHEESTTPLEREISVCLFQGSSRITSVIHGGEPLEQNDLNNQIDTTECTPPAQEWEHIIPPSQRVYTTQLKGYEEWILKSDAYRWLLAKLRIRTQIYCPGPNIKDKIGSDIRRKVVRSMRGGNLTPTIEMRISVHWGLEKYIESLGVSRSPHIWNHILCLTGSCNDLQAVPVATYLRQTWPTTGERLEDVLLGLLHCQPGEEYSYVFSPTLHVRLEVFYTGECIINAHGDPYTIPEFAEQIAWLATALRLSPQKTPAMVSPHMRMARVVRYIPQDSKTITIAGALSFKAQDNKEPPVSVNGTCWTRLFTNPIIVSGYPILRKSTPAAGLEASLSIMTSLLQAQQLVRLENRIIMKGFDALLVATEIFADDNLIMWHAYASSKPGKRISYFDPRIEETTPNERDLPLLRSLENCRHVIGWCSETTDFCGHPQADLNISASGTLPSPSYSVIDRLYIEGGMYVIGGLNARINQREQPIISGEARDFSQVLGWLSEQFVNFYDLTDRRAWLVDGASALLHLVRISLQLDETDPDSPYDWVFDKSQLKENWIDRGGRAAAIRTLKDWENRALNVYIKDRSFGNGRPVDTYSTFGNRVDKILHTLELIIEARTRVAAEGGTRVNQSLDTRKSIVGFDILDLVKSRPQFVSHIERFSSGENGWVDLLPNIGVLTVFGKGFGDLIRPSNADAMCEEWRSVPKGGNHLTSSVSTLALLYKEKLQQLEPGREPGVLTRKFDWVSPCRPFDSCRCLKGEQTGKLEHHDPAQYIVSRTFLRTRILKEVVPVDISSLTATGAVVFVNLSSSGRRIKPKVVKETEHHLQQPTVGTESSSGNGSLTASASQSTTAQSSDSTNATETSAYVADPETGQGRSGPVEDQGISAKWREKMKKRLKTFYPSQRRPAP